MIKHFRRFLLAAALIAAPAAFANEGGPHLDKAPLNLRDAESLQAGATVFANYCLSCHGALNMRYNRLQDIGLTEAQIKANLMFASDKVGDQMKVAMQAADAKSWFGATPPDLSVIARSRGADWLYTYLRTFYRDESRPTGWNNSTFDKVGMPHVLWELQGVQEAEYKVEKNAEGKEEKHLEGLKLVKPGLMTRISEDGKYDQSEFDKRVGDLVNYLVFMSEPAQTKREQIGYTVLLFLLFVLVPLTYVLKKEYWRDVH
ncbi:ubiquinol-cytochrome c reductase cytochrome c1 subunit [Andreprevotia lacus DSM 23236]|jgi:ubiquinol-cytochrome c reductase cytochrome c1 subunit|uniref:Ubiquinol-cytochrome c reductase cytochrome c1 subunit n=1 Tax=Andreprevotia lacus DSM 23236 TaxID=1121001 RepID=A0A1W1XSP3_9NEIS|nr:cytochrome c1 [Andreprevotia lacus]SMC26884.1 ubiquinol-cytochrome c reductase cytochrome c1 subunit [Andreprevotia lacus DSM 23236]